MRNGTAVYPESVAAEPGLTPGRRPDKAQRRIAQVVALIHERYSTPLTLHDVARAVGLGKLTLSHEFRAVARTSFRALLIKVRVTEAAARLLSSATPVTDIAEQVGFGDRSRFNRTFKKQFGMSPRDYRKQNRRAAREV